MNMDFTIKSKKKKIEKLMRETSLPIGDVIFNLVLIDAIYNNKTRRFEVPLIKLKKAFPHFSDEIKEKGGVVGHTPVHWELTDEYFTFWLK